MNETTYTINHAGYTVHREAARFRILDGSDALKNLSITDGKYKSTGLCVDSGNVWLDCTLVVQEGRALCFAAAHGGYRFIRRPRKGCDRSRGTGHKRAHEMGLVVPNLDSRLQACHHAGGEYRRFEENALYVRELFLDTASRCPIFRQAHLPITTTHGSPICENCDIRSRTMIGRTLSRKKLHRFSASGAEINASFAIRNTSNTMVPVFPKRSLAFMQQILHSKEIMHSNAGMRGSGASKSSKTAKN